MKTYLRCLNGVLLLALLLPGVGSPVWAAQPKTTVTALVALKGVAERAADALQASLWAVEAEPVPVSDVEQAAASPHTASPLFIENVGQFAEGARFQMFGGDALWLADDALWLTVLEPESAEAQTTSRDFQNPKSKIQNQPPRSGVNLRLSFPNANPNPRLEPFDRLDTTVSYFKGSDPAGWHSAVPVWGGVRYVDLYPGIDLEVTGENGRWVQRLHARPGADLSQVQLRVEGAEAVEADGIGGLRTSTAAGEVGLPLLRVDEPTEAANARLNVQEVGARTFDVVAPFIATSGDATSSFSIHQIQDNPSQLIYSAYIGGDDSLWNWDIALDTVGAAYTIGETAASDFPNNVGLFDTTLAGPGHFLLKVAHGGAVLSYVIFLGENIYLTSVAVNRDGAAYVVGDTSDYASFPASGWFGAPPDDPYNETFVAKVSPDGSALNYAKFLGGTGGGDSIFDMVVDEEGAAYICGVTMSDDFPTANAYDDTLGNDDGIPELSDAFVTKVNPDGSALEFSTFLGGNAGSERGLAIAIDANKAVYVVGHGVNYDFPTTPGAYDTTYNNNDGFLVRMTPDGSDLEYATFIGGTNGDFGIAVSNREAVVVGMRGCSGEFTTTPGAFDATCEGDGDFAIKLSSNGGFAVYSTFMDAARIDPFGGVAVDNAGAAYFVGSPDSADFPFTDNAYDTTYNGGDHDGVIVKLQPDGRALTYASFFGGDGDDYISALAVDRNGIVHVTGATHSSNFPVTPGALNSSADAGLFIAKLNVSSFLMSGPFLTATPLSLDADGVATATVALVNAPVGHEVRIFSHRNGVDLFDNPVGVVDGGGRFTTTVRSAAPGVAAFRAENLTTGQFFAASARVTFTGEDGGPPPLPPGGDFPVEIVSVESTLPLDARYFQGLDAINRIEVIVDWKNTMAGSLHYLLNGQEFTIQAHATATTTFIIENFDMGKQLKEGLNSLTFIAVNPLGGQSNPVAFSPRLMATPDWLKGLLESGMLDKLSFLSVTATNSFSIPKDPWEIEGGPVKIEAGFEGKYGVSLRCDEVASFEVKGSADLSAELKSITLGGILEASGGLTAKAVECWIPTAEGNVKVTATLYGQKEWPAVILIAEFINPAAGAALEHVVGLIGVGLDATEFLGKVYVRGEIGGSLGSEWLFIPQDPYLEWKNYTVEFTPKLSAGYEFDQLGMKFKAYVAVKGNASQTIPTIRDFSLNKWNELSFGGGVGYSFKPPLQQCTYDREYEITWTYTPATDKWEQESELIISRDCEIFSRQSAQNYAVFRAAPTSAQAFAPHDSGPSRLSAQATVTSVLVSNVYTYTEPSLAVNANDDALVLWVHDDLGKPNLQSLELYFSRWNGASWSAPAALTNDSMMDGIPQVAWTNDDRAVAVWSRLNGVQPIEAGWDAATAQKIEIATAVYTAATNTWSPATLLTTNTALDLKPQLARNGAGELLAVWRQNAAGLLGGNDANPDQIVVAVYDGAWSANVAAVSDIPGLVDLTAGYGDNAATIAYTSYVTPTGQPTPTLQLFTAAWNGASWAAPIQRTDDNLGHTNPQVVYNTLNQPLLVWLAGSELRLRNLTTTANAALPLDLAATIDTFRIAQDADGNIAAVFTAQGAQRDLYLSYYDEAHNLWGRPTPLTNDRANEDYPSAGLDSTGRLLLSYSAAATYSVTRTMTLSGTSAIITYTVPVEGQTDLLTLSHVFSDNLALNDGDLVTSDAYPAPGDTVALSATVRNSGDRALDGVSVAFYHGDPLAGGDLIGSAALAAPLAAGFTATLGISYTVPLGGVAHPLYAVADSGNAIVEFDENDNGATLAAFGPDLEIVAEVDDWGGDNVGLRTRIRNLGATAAPAATLAFYRDALTGTLAVTDVVPSLAAGETLTLTTPWSFGALPAGSYPLAAVVNHNQADFAEAVTANNAVAFTLDVLPDLMVTPYALWTGPITGSSVTITVALYNLGTIAATNVDVAFYSSPVFTNSTRLFTRTVPLLAPAAMTVLTGTAAGSLRHGLFVLVDPAYTLAETTRLNNVAFIQNGESGKAIYLPLVLRTA